jgi:hypothetical protein
LQHCGPPEQEQAFPSDQHPGLLEFFAYDAPFLKYNIMVTTHVARLKLFRLKAEGAGRAQLRRFGGETVDSCTEYGFKIRSIPAFP